MKIGDYKVERRDYDNVAVTYIVKASDYVEKWPKINRHIIVLSFANLLGHYNHFANTQIRPLFTSFVFSRTMWLLKSKHKNPWSQCWTRRESWAIGEPISIILLLRGPNFSIEDCSFLILFQIWQILICTTANSFRVFSLWGRQSAQSCMTE